MRKIIFFSTIIALFIGIYLFLSQKETTNNQVSSVTDNAPLSIVTGQSDSDESTKLDNKITDNLAEDTFVFRIVQPEKQKYPRRLDAVYEQLKLEADTGNLKAAQVLGSTLKQCHIYPRTKEEKKEFVDDLNENGVFPQGVDMCMNITDEQISETLDYLKQGASENNVSALLELANVADPRLLGYDDAEIAADPELTNILNEQNLLRLDALERAAENGSLTAVKSLAVDYDLGTAFPDKNKMLARYYYKATYLMNGSEGIYQRLEETERYLSHDEIVQSDLMAEELLSNWGNLDRIYN